MVGLVVEHAHLELNMKRPLRRFASPPSRGAALAVRQSRPGGALGLSRVNP